MALTPKDVEELHESSKKLLGLWMQIKLVFLKSFGSGELTPGHEHAYLQLKSDISRINRAVSERLTAGLKFDSEKLMEMLKNAITMEHLRNQPSNEKQNIYAMWHRIYIKLTRTLGALEIMQAGYYPHVHRARLKSMASSTKVRRSVRV
jgi:hypothetical protein